MYEKKLPEGSARNRATFRASSIAERARSLAARLAGPVRSPLRSRESVLQEEEELAMFATIEEVAAQVRRDADEMMIIQHTSKKAAMEPPKSNK